MTDTKFLKLEVVTCIEIESLEDNNVIAILRKL